MDARGAIETCKSFVKLTSSPATRAAVSRVYLANTFLQVTVGSTAFCLACMVCVCVWGGMLVFIPLPYICLASRIKRIIAIKNC